MTGQPYRFGRPPREVMEAGVKKARAALEDAKKDRAPVKERKEAAAPAVQCTHPAWNRDGDKEICASCGTPRVVSVPQNPKGTR